MPARSPWLRFRQRDDPRLRQDQALSACGELRDRPRGAPWHGVERGAVTASRRLKEVARGRVALVGDASGSVDAITGEGLCRAFRQAAALAGALAAGSLAGYREEHRRLMRRPERMAPLGRLAAAAGGGVESLTTTARAR